ncbi:extensin-like [Penaeus monodon]|uniref:extensin-like n=1 Tax=Penaeus monodon TaxID=6687 RepID=UPI0018A716AA|nr:extensin-like [Penaeus monodon]
MKSSLSPDAPRVEGLSRTESRYSGRRSEHRPYTLRPQALLHPPSASALTPSVRKRPYTLRPQALLHPLSASALTPSVRKRPYTLRPQAPLHPPSASAPTPSVRKRPYTPRPQAPLHPPSASALTPSVRKRPYTLRPQAPLHPPSASAPTPSVRKRPYTLRPQNPYTLHTILHSQTCGSNHAPPPSISDGCNHAITVYWYWIKKKKTDCIMNLSNGKSGQEVASSSQVSPGVVQSIRV